MDPDQLASEKPADLDLHCFSKHDRFRFSMGRVNVFKVAIHWQVHQHVRFWIEITIILIIACRQSGLGKTKIRLLTIAI